LKRASSIYSSHVKVSFVIADLPYESYAFAIRGEAGSTLKARFSGQRNDLKRLFSRSLPA
jgi:hypothetical protein